MTTPPRQGKDGVMEDLIARLIAADGPSRELDCLIGAAVDADCGLAMGMRFAQYVESYGVAWAVEQAESYQSIIRTGLPRYTASLDAAMTLVPHFEPRTHWHLQCYPHGCYSATVSDKFPVGNHFAGQHMTSPAIALCIAALKARIQP